MWFYCLLSTIRARKIECKYYFFHIWSKKLSFWLFLVKKRYLLDCATVNGRSELNSRKFPKIDHQFIRLKEKMNIKKSEIESVHFSKRYRWSSGRPLIPFYFSWFWSIFLKWTNFVFRTTRISFSKMNRFFFWFFYINLLF